MTDRNGMATRWDYFLMRYHYYRWARQLPNQYSDLADFRQGRLSCAIDAFLDVLQAWQNFK
jgi:hypothetical protein